jgi:predicted ATPase
VPEDVANILPYLATLLSIQVRGGLDHRVHFLDAETLKSQIYRAFYLLVTTLMKKRPLVLEFEDFHWADASTVALLIHTLISHDLLEKKPVTGQHTVKPLSGKIQIPDTLRGLVTSSVDRLDSQSKDVLKKASVIGRSFLYRLLKIIEGRSDLLDDHLSVLITENLIKEKCADPELEYYFYHDLIKDAVYETILSFLSFCQGIGVEQGPQVFCPGR